MKLNEINKSINEIESTISHGPTSFEMDKSEVERSFSLERSL